MNNTYVEDRVFKSRASSLWDEELNSICLFSVRDIPEDKGSDAQLWYKSNYDVAINVLVKETDEIDSEMDDICKQIEDIILPLHYLKDPESGEELCEKLKLSSSEFHLAQVGKVIMGSVIMTLSLKYYTELLPVEQTEDWKSSNAQWKLPGNTADTPNPEDTFEMEQA